MKRIQLPEPSFLRRQEPVNKENKTLLIISQTNKRVKYFLAPMLMLFFSLQGFSQGMIAPPSPNAQALARYAAVPVSYYTGTPAINIPIYTLQGKELSMPVSLSYNASGHKVKDIASWVGLGWSLNAGGVITRMVRGLPDEDVNGYCGNSAIGYKAENPYAMNITDRKEYFSKILTGDWDGEPDMFYFNFMGRSGRFVIAPNGMPYIIPHQNLSIKPGICSSGGSEWIITDENGTRYIFGKDGNSRESSNTKYISKSSTITKSYISSWYLSRVESANGTDVINLSYQNGSSHTEKYRTNYEVRNNNWFNDPTGDPCPAIYESGIWSDITQVTITPKYVNKIWNSFGSINFLVDQKFTRKDLKGARNLKSIVIKDNNSNIIKSYQLGVDYFSSGCSGELCKRLKLTGVYEDWQLMVAFKYNEAVNLPARNSFSFDHWGYANNSTDPKGLDDTSSLPDATRMLANSISEIKYSQGAKISFEFEPHDYLKSYIDYVNGGVYSYYNIMVGGLRIKSKTVSEGTNNHITTNYSYLLPGSTYSSGSIYALPQYNTTIWGTYNTIKYTIKYSSSTNSLFDIGGGHVGYSTVRETSSFFNTTYHFTSFASNRDTKNNLRAVGGYEITDLFQPPYVPGDYFGWERGLLLDKTVKTASGKTVQVVTNEYEFNAPVVKLLNGTMVSPYRLSSFSPCRRTDFAIGSYTLTSKPLYLLKTTTETYEQENNNNKSTSVQEFVYNQQNQLSKTKAYNLAQSSSKQITKIKYVNHPDYNWSATQQCVDDNIDCYNNANTDDEIDACDDAYYYCIYNLPVAGIDAKAILDLRIKHAINVPVEQLNIIQEGGIQYLVGATYTKFKTQGTSGQMVVPFRSYVIDKLTPYTGYQTSTINNSGNFIEPTVPGVTYKLAGTSNFSTSTGQLTAQTSNDATTTSYAYNTNGILLSTSTTNGSLATTASQVVAPLIGVTQKTDANGRQVNYTYDKKGRLKYIKDHDNNVVTRYRYNTETPLTSQIEVDGSFLVGDQINFKSTNPFDHGVSTITWDFGDGTVVENAPLSTSHIYTQSGFYQVKLVITNPEYDYLIVNKSVPIHAPFSGGLILSNNDPIVGSLDLCDLSWPEGMYNNLSVTGVQGGGLIASYKWYRIFNGSTPISINPTNGITVSYAGQHTIRCVLTNIYGDEYTIEKTISASSTDCNGGGGIY